VVAFSDGEFELSSEPLLAAVSGPSIEVLVEVVVLAFLVVPDFFE